MHCRYFALAFGFVALACTAQEASRHSHKPSAGYVPDAATAIRIAVAIWEPIYGRKEISHQAPYKARLIGTVWIVEGTLPPNMLGGVALAEIAKDDGRVHRVSHGK